MIGVTNNTPQQINASLIAMKNEIKREIITETKIEQYESEVIDDTKTSTSKTWSSEKISSEMYPLGFIYMQLYNPTSAIWEKSPSSLGMTPASGCKWEEITSDFASFPYLKIGSGTTQSGHNAYHTHSFNHAHKHSHIAYTGCYPTSRETQGHGLGLNPAFMNRVMVSASSNVGTSEDVTGPYVWDGSKWTPHDYTSYNGNSAEQTVEVNASNMKIWKVVADV